jgi:hypothetical protein
MQKNSSAAKLAEIAIDCGDDPARRRREEAGANLGLVFDETTTREAEHASERGGKQW